MAKSVDQGFPEGEWWEQRLVPALQHPGLDAARHRQVTPQEQVGLLQQQERMAVELPLVEGTRSW